MKFSNPAKNFMKIAAVVGQLNSLAILLDPANGEARWQALQDWLKKNPDKKKTIERAAAMEPDNALVYLLDSVGINLITLAPFDPQGTIKQRATTAIGHLQELYKSRKEFGADGRRLRSPGAKRKKKVVDRKSQIIEGEIIDAES